MSKIALVTGGNKGIGYEACRHLAQEGFKVILTSRNRELGTIATEQLLKEGLDVHYEQMDISDQKSVDDCTMNLKNQDLEVDVLINNAGVLYEELLLADDISNFSKTLNVNFFGTFKVCRAFIPGMIKRNYGRIVTISSTSGSFGNGLQGPPYYCISKVASNALTVCLSRELVHDVKINSMCPGWVKTDMGGPNAVLTTEESMETIIWLATLPDDGPNGGFFKDKKPLAW